MEFRTKIDISPSLLRISYNTKMMLFGSCFAENIGTLLTLNKFDVNVNPFGILYNPLSIAKAISRLLEDKEFEHSNLFNHNELYHSFLHHGNYSKPKAEDSLRLINASLQKAADDVLKSDLLIITFGTSYVFREVASGEVVSNCHKLPARNFDRYRARVEDIVKEWSALIDNLRKQNPSLRFLFTVSPIRHWKDGAHDNQLSKSVLLLAIDELQEKFDDIFYFPSYELMLDDLRDYRFYAEDMTHPNNTAVTYIWGAFRQSFFDAHTEDVMKQWNIIKQALEHRPINAESKEHKEFLRQTLLKLDTFQQKYSYFSCELEKESLLKQLYTEK
ncbi:GSCFA domain protein [Dysgonomonas sp. 216]|uniref:GSCFA domain-containing protein n=1 Tax=Dysgonomonas sp. 216 TaxID=2302934 RepID=UPI0013D5EA6D|nr:GSCFA domain-containing protein [Dysgonomonas sp. 216]NDW18220.1 GSCFA domain protein [Dysgonomonas sp. 216]